MVPGGLPSSAGRDALIAPRKKQRPLIRYAGSAAETSIGSKPIGSELNVQFYPWCSPCQVMRQSCSLAKLPVAQQRHCLSRLRQK
jgi:hypothetical protein